MQKYTAIILSSCDVGEYDRIYSMYTLEEGLIRVKARGVRKTAAKLAGHLEPGTLSEIYVAKRRGMGNITSAITLESFSVTQDYQKLEAMLEIFSFLGRNFSEGERDAKVFALIKDFLAELQKKGGDPCLVAAAFWWKLFDCLGNRPEVMRCSRCKGALGEKQQNYFDVKRGGVVCAGCRAGREFEMPVSIEKIKLLRLMLANPVGKIVRVKANAREVVGLKQLAKLFGKFNY